MEPHRSPETQLLQSTTTCIVQIDNKVCQLRSIHVDFISSVVINHATIAALKSDQRGKLGTK